jgi:hypothetical protein
VVLSPGIFLVAHPDSPALKIEELLCRWQQLRSVQSAAASHCIVAALGQGVQEVMGFFLCYDKVEKKRAPS